MEGESSGVQQAQGQVGQSKNQQQGGQGPGVDALSGRSGTSRIPRRTR